MRNDDDQRMPTFMVKAVNGVFQAHYHNNRSKTYTLINQTDRERIVYVEHPIDEGGEWELLARGPQPITKTADYYRFRVVLKPHEKSDLVIAEQQERFDSFQLASLSSTQLNLLITQRYIDEQTRGVLAKIVDLRSQIGALDSSLQANDREKTEISADQQRLRDNIKTLTSTAEAKQLIARYVAKADAQETRLQQIEKDRKTLQEQRRQLQTELESLVRGISFDRKLNT